MRACLDRFRTPKTVKFCVFLEQAGECRIQADVIYNHLDPGKPLSSSQIASRDHSLSTHHKTTRAPLYLMHGTQTYGTAMIQNPLVQTRQLELCMTAWREQVICHLTLNPSVGPRRNVQPLISRSIP
jgi:hypothetical protein